VKELYERFGSVLDVISNHLRADRMLDAIAVIDSIDDDKVRHFAFFACLCVHRDLEVLRLEVRYRVQREMSMIMPSQN